MTMQHEIKIGSFILPVLRVNNDGSIMIDLPRKGRFIPGKNVIITTAKSGKIQSLKVSK